MAYLSSAHHLCVLRLWLYLEWTGCAWMRNTERYATNASPAAAALALQTLHACRGVCCLLTQREPACTALLCSIHTHAGSQCLRAYDTHLPTFAPNVVLRTMQVGYETLNQMLGCTAAYPAKRIVRVGGPDDRCGRRCATRYETLLMVHGWLDLLVCLQHPCGSGSHRDRRYHSSKALGNGRHAHSCMLLLLLLLLCCGWLPCQVRHTAGAGPGCRWCDGAPRQQQGRRRAGAHCSM
jgi:hypothetical protein